MKFKKIKVTGFKSFVDPTEIVIEEGLTGIVGPNGCGKSNVVESLRWCMGETSPKSMRGSGMEDVIFSGTSDRPARNNAEVTISLDNKDRKVLDQNEHGLIINDMIILAVNNNIKRLILDDLIEGVSSDLKTKVYLITRKKFLLTN